MRQRLIETFEVRGPFVEQSRWLLSEQARAAGWRLLDAELAEHWFPFWLRPGTAEGLLYATERVQHPLMPNGTMGDDLEEDRFLNWNLVGYQGIALRSDTPARWAAVPAQVELEPVHAESFRSVTDDEIEAGVRAGIEEQLVASARSRGWSVVNTKVTLDPSGSAFLAMVPFVRATFRVEPIRTPAGAKLADPGAVHASWFSPDGRAVWDGLPSLRFVRRPYFVLGVVFGILFGVVVAAAVVALAAIWLTTR